MLLTELLNVSVFLHHLDNLSGLLIIGLRSTMQPQTNPGILQFIIIVENLSALIV